MVYWRKKDRYVNPPSLGWYLLVWGWGWCPCCFPVSRRELPLPSICRMSRLGDEGGQERQYQNDFAHFSPTSSHPSSHLWPPLLETTSSSPVHTTSPASLAFRQSKLNRNGAPPVFPVFPGMPTKKYPRGNPKVKTTTTSVCHVGDAHKTCSSLRCRYIAACTWPADAPATPATPATLLVCTQA